MEEERRMKERGIKKKRRGKIRRKEEGMKEITTKK